MPLAEFVLREQREITLALPDTPAGFQSLNRYLWKERWLLRYADVPFLAQVLNGMAQRRPRLSARGKIYPEIQTNYDRLETAFWQLYPAMMDACSAPAGAPTGRRSPGRPMVCPPIGNEARSVY